MDLNAERQKVEERKAAWEARFARLCAEAKLSELQAKVLRATLTGKPLHLLAKELYGPIDLPKSATQEEKLAILERADRQANGLALALVQANRRIEVRFPEIRKSGVDFARDVLSAVRNKGHDWAYEPIGGEQHIRFETAPSERPSKARLVMPRDLRVSTETCVAAWARQA